MQIDIQARDFSLTQSLRSHVERRLGFALGPRYDRISRILVRLSDINGPRGGRDKRCRLHLVMPGRANVVIEDTRADLYAAIDCAADRAARTVARKLARLRSCRRNRWTEGAVPAPVLNAQNA
jgi:ribosomal subunit interface protein